MINKLLTYLLSIFYRVNKETISTEVWTPEPDLEFNTEETFLVPEKKLINNIEKKSKPVNKERVMNQIKTNIYFLDTLIEEMSPFFEYASYVVKLEDMKKQSQGCLRILFRMNENAPYFVHTLKTVYSHTKTISELMEE